VPGVALVERQEPGGVVVESGGHPYFGVVHREVHQGPVTERQQRLGLAGRRVSGGAVLLVLGDGEVDVLGELALQLGGGHG